MIAPSKRSRRFCVDGQAEEAVEFYLSVFKDGTIHSMARFPEGSPGDNKPGTVMTIAFELKGQQFVALNGGPGFPFTNAVSLVVNCDSQEEIDYFWEKLPADGGEPNVCGWVRDQFGMPWQIVPSQIWDWLNGADPAIVRASPARCGQWKSSTSRSCKPRLVRGNQRAALCGRTAALSDSALAPVEVFSMCRLRS